jgi:hypothetical protein
MKIVVQLFAGFICLTQKGYQMVSLSSPFLVRISNGTNISKMGAQKGKNPKVSQRVVVGTPFLLGYTLVSSGVRPHSHFWTEKRSEHHHR